MLLQDKIAWRTYCIARVIRDLKSAITCNNKSIFGSKFWNKVFLQSPHTLLYMIQNKKVQACFEFRTPTKPTQSIPSPNANKSLCCSLLKQNNCYIDSNPSVTCSTEFENSNQHTLMQIHIHPLQSHMHCTLSLHAFNILWCHQRYHFHLT